MHFCPQFMTINDRKDVVQVAKVGESLWFFIYYSAVFAAGITYLWDKEWLHDPRAYWLPSALEVPEFPYVFMKHFHSF